jgi:hypothetical protein
MIVMQLPHIQRVFQRYCSGFDHAMERLEKLRPTLSAYEIDCMQLSRGRTTAWDLASLICKPVQRVLKYPLLLEAILSTTDADHPDHANLRLALERMLRVAAEINESKRRHEIVGSIVGKRVRKHSKAATRPRHSEPSPRSFGKSFSKALLRPPKSKISEVEGQLAEDFELYDSLVASFDAQHDAVQLFASQITAWSDNLRQLLRSQRPLIKCWVELYEPLDNEAQVNGGGPTALRHYTESIAPQLKAMWRDTVRFPLTSSSFRRMLTLLRFRTIKFAMFFCPKYLNSSLCIVRLAL